MSRSKEKKDQLEKPPKIEPMKNKNNLKSNHGPIKNNLKSTRASGDGDRPKLEVTISSKEKSTHKLLIIITTTKN